MWVRPTFANAQRVWDALVAFGAPLSKLKVEDLATPDVVYQIGVAPRRIDILTSITGVEFDEAWDQRLTLAMDGLLVPVLGRAELLRNKRATGRPQDAVDADTLEAGDE